MHKRRALAISAFLFLAISQVFGASFIVPTDRELIHAAKGIVIATALGSHTIQGDQGIIYTVYQVEIEQVIKGKFEGETLELVEPGGCLEGRCVLAPGAPQYLPGERALIFLDTHRQTEWRTWSMVLGKFNFVHDLHGKRLLVRGGDDGEIFGWDALGNRHVEPLRSEEAFLNYIRAVVANQPAEENYLLDRKDVTFGRSIRPEVNSQGFHAANYMAPVGGFAGIRWQCIFDQPPNGPGCGGNGSVSFVLVGTASGVNGPAAASAGMAAWNGNAQSNVNYVSGGAGSAPFTQNDGISSIHFDDDVDTAKCGGAAVGCTFYGGAGSGYMFDGGNFLQTSDADIAMKTGFTTNQTFYSQIVCHELGHGLGLRHSDTGVPSTSAAVMVSSANAGSPFGPVLQSYDHDAVSTGYNPNPGGAPPPPCTPPSITVQPQNQTITAGQSTILSVTATGTATLTYQWYIGMMGNTSSPIAGATSSSVMVSPMSTTSYWVRVTGQCAPTADSMTATVTVNPAVCQPVSIILQPQNTQIQPGQTAILNVGVTGSNPFSYQWFTGNPGSGTPIPGATNSSLSVSPPSTTNYFVQVTNCNGANTVTSTVATVSVVAGCTPPANATASAAPTSVSPGQQVTLSVFVGIGTQPFTFQWFRGAAPDPSNPISGGTSFSITDSPSVTSNYWVKVTNSCGSTNSNTVTVTVGTACVAPAITGQPQSVTINAGTSATLVVSASGTNLHYAWFQGSLGDTSSPVGSDSATFTTAALNTDTQFWVHVQNECGAVNSGTVTVTVKHGRRRSVRH